MNEVLSREETDALLRGIEDGSVATEGGTPADGEIRPYDFAEQDSIVRGGMATLARINERLARTLQGHLRELLDHEAEVTALELGTRRCATYFQSLQTPSALELLALPPLPGTALLVFDPTFVYLAVDAYFGGLGRAPAERERRDFTPGELRVVEMIRARVLADLGEAWRPVTSIEPRHTGSEHDPRFLDFASPGQSLILCRFETRFAGGTGEIQLALPASMLEPVRELLDGGLSTGETVDHAQWSGSLRQRLEDVPIGISSALLEMELSLRELLRLKPGDVIPVELPETILAASGGTPLLRARFGASRGRNALMVTERIKPRRNGK